MTSAYEEAARRLQQEDFEVTPENLGANPAFAFENETILGFAIFYSTAAELILAGASDAEALIARHRFQLRAAGNKAWNTYVLLLADKPSSPSEGVALSLIEEDLSGYRKIARAGCSQSAELSRALLPLVRFQAAPTLEAVDSKAEVRQRATELSSALLDAFLSEADEHVVAQYLEQDT